MCWKFILLHFRVGGQTKYTLETFKLSNLSFAIKAHQLIWNRICNPKGGSGNKIQLDLGNEFLNSVFKDNINTFRQNINSHSVDRSSRQWSELVTHWRTLTVSPMSIMKVANMFSLTQVKIFDLYFRWYKVSKCLHTHLIVHTPHWRKSVLPDRFSNLNLKELHKWLKRHRKMHPLSKQCYTTPFELFVSVKFSEIWLVTQETSILSQSYSSFMHNLRH